MFTKGFKKTSQDTAGTIARAGGGGPPINQKNMAAVQAGAQKSQSLVQGIKDFSNRSIKDWW